MNSDKSDKGEISITSETSYIDVGLGEIFVGKLPDPMLGGQYGITLSEISLFISNKLDEVYFSGRPEKKRVSMIDISCSSFFQGQPHVPDIPAGIGIGGRTKRNRRSKTKRRSRINERNERRGRNNSKIRNRRNRRMSERTRKNRRRRS